MSRTSEIGVAGVITLTLGPVKEMCRAQIACLGDGQIVYSPLHGLGTVRTVGTDTIIRFKNNLSIDGGSFMDSGLAVLNEETLASDVEIISSVPTDAAEATGNPNTELYHCGQRIGEWIDSTQERRDPLAPFIPNTLTMIRYGFARLNRHPATAKVNFTAFARLRRGMKLIQIGLNKDWISMWSRVELLEICYG